MRHGRDFVPVVLLQWSQISLETGDGGFKTSPWVEKTLSFLFVSSYYLSLLSFWLLCPLYF